MLWVPRKGKLLYESSTESAGAVPGAAVTTDAASSSTKGTIVEQIAATAFDAFLLHVTVMGGSAAASNNSLAVDILIGAATEELLIENLLGGGAPGRGLKQWLFPLHIPAGSRLSARVAGARLAASMQIQLFLYGGLLSPPFRVAQKVTTYGMGTVPNGTSITPGATGAAGSWAEITSGTSEDHFAVVPSFQAGNDTTQNNRWIRVEMGIGAAAAEEIISDGYWFATDSSEEMHGPLNPMPCMCDIPSGTRLAMRASNEGTNDAAYDGVIHALS
jgi:hypothetical protein